MWRVTTPSNDRKFMVKGTELATMLVPGTHGRYQLCEIRAYGADWMPDRKYYVRDADTVSDAEVREGKRSEVVARFDTEDAALNFCWFGISVPKFRV